MEEQPVFYPLLQHQNKTLRSKLYNNSTYYHKFGKNCIYERTKKKLNFQI